MLGTLVNVATVLAGSIVGVGVGRFMPPRLQRTVMDALGLCSLFIGITMLISPGEAARPNLPLVVGCLIAGGIVGELCRLQQHVESLGGWLKARLRSRSPTFVEGFVTASMLFCVGAMTIQGSLEDGALGRPGLLITKAIMDGFASIILATSLGVGVAASALTILLVQGGLTLAAARLDFLLDPVVLAQVRGAGGVLIIGVGLGLLEIRKLPLINYMPALLLAVLAQLWLSRG